MNVAAAAATRAPANLVEIFDVAGGDTLLIVKSCIGGAVARLDPRARALVGSSAVLALEARTLGGIDVTVDLGDPGGAPRRAAAVMITADARGVMIALLDRSRAVLAAARLDSATTARLTGDAAP